MPEYLNVYECGHTRTRYYRDAEHAAEALAGAKELQCPACFATGLVEMLGQAVNPRHEDDRREIKLLVKRAVL